MNLLPAFFERIGLAADTRVTHTVEFLKLVQYQCVTNIAYENLDILDGKPLSLEPEMIYDKIVRRGRGGYCFEVNGLLSMMLAEMGFKVADRFARYLRGEEETPMRRHRIVAVDLEDGTYICDIGIGQTAPRYPVKLEIGLVQEQFGETYRFDFDDALGFILCDLHEGAWRRFFSFTNEAQYPIDFVQPSFWCEHHPDSPFNKAPMLAIKTEKGRKTIDGRTFKIFTDDTLEYIEENIADDRFMELLAGEFKLK